ncbi:MAG: gliding motility-associated C-terminal domain-containing protein, partial [Flavobacteriia bacterium]
VLSNGIHTVIFTVTDTGGNTTTCSITVTVSGCVCTPPSAPTGSASQNFCSIDTPTVADLLASGTAITWYDQPTGGTAYNSTDPLVDGAHYYGSQTVGGCESATRLDVVVTIAAPTAPVATSSSITECEESPVQTLDANSVLSSTTGVTWYDAAAGGNVVASATLNAVGTVTYYAEYNDGTCSSLTRTEVVLNIIDSPNSPIGDTTQMFCKNINPELVDIVFVGQSIQYYDSNNNLLPSNTLLSDGETYYVTQTVGGCESSLNYSVTVYLDSLELNLLTSTSSFCNASNGSAQVIANNGYPSYNYLWENGTQSSVITGLSVGDYLVTATDSLGCQAILNVSINCIERLIPGFVSVGGSGSGSGGSGNSTWVTNLPLEAEVQIFNRWGNLIFKACPYLDDFVGKSNQGGTLGDDYLPSGTYFYIIDYKNGEAPVSGYIEFVR